MNPAHDGHEARKSVVSPDPADEVARAVERVTYPSGSLLARLKGRAYSCDADIDASVMEEAVVEIERLTARLAVLEEENRLDQAALKPFADAADIKLCGVWMDEEKFWRTDAAHRLTFGDLRLARSRLQARTPSAQDDQTGTGAGDFSSFRKSEIPSAPADTPPATGKFWP